MAGQVVMMGRMPRPTWGERGTTLVELAVGLAVATVLFLGVVLIWQQGLAAYFQSSETADLQQEARVGYQRMAKELRLAGVHPCTTSITAVTQAASDSVTFQYDVPSDTVNCTTLPTLRTVQYAYDAANSRATRQQDAGTANPLTGGTIGTLTFQYWNCNGTELVPPGALDTQAKRDAVARITVTIGASENYNGTPLARQIGGDIHLRGKSCPNVGY